MQGPLLWVLGKIEMLKRIWGRHLKPLIASVGFVGGVAFSSLYYQTHTNRLRFEDELQEDQKYKDNTRDDNEYFGINWGFRADALIRDKIDSGDIFLIKYECSNCLSMRDGLFCRYLQMLNNDQDYDSLAFAYRDKTGLYVIASQFGKTQVSARCGRKEDDDRRLSLRK